MLHAWVSAVRYTRGRGAPIPVFVFLYLAISVQYIFPAVESAIMIVAVAVGEVVYLRPWRPTLRLLLVAGCAGLAGLSTFLPSMLSSSVTWRGNQRILNDSFLDVPWSESLNASLPSTVPAFESWWGYVQPLPMVYIAWFLIPLLAFIDSPAVRRAIREFTGPALFALIFLMWTAGPGHIGPLRWPARVLPMLAIGLLVLVCVLLSRYGTFVDWRRRGTTAAVLIGLLFVRTFCAALHLVLRHLVAVFAALTVAVVWAARTRGTALACVLAILAMFPIAYDQVRAQGATPMSYHFPESSASSSRSGPTAALSRWCCGPCRGGSMNGRPSPGRRVGLSHDATSPRAPEGRLRRLLPPPARNATGVLTVEPSAAGPPPRRFSTADSVAQWPPL